MEKPWNRCRKGRNSIRCRSLLTSQSDGPSTSVAATKRHRNSLGELLELDANYPVTYWILGLVLRKTGSYELAIAEGEKGVKLSNGSALDERLLAQILGSAGATEALEILDDLDGKLAKQKYVGRPASSPESISAWGKTTAHFEYLDKSYEEHSHWLIYLHIDPSMDALRDNLRFQDLLQRVGLPH